MTHSTLIAAAAGTLPAWADASPSRRAHMGRVANLLERWAVDLDLDGDDILRWRAAGILHDALRDADPRTLAPMVNGALENAPDDVLHAPAAAARLAADGVDDPALLRAIAWHPIGHPDLDRLGHALYLADYLEPGRTHAPARATRWRERVPVEMDAVLQEVAAERIAHALHRGRPLLDPTVRFWNGLVHA
jgi:HD superfamily phosphohydrolase YqeK